MTCQAERPDLVTEREAEVLELVARHHTNAQIADALYISVRTVESHVSSMLRKLGLPDRRSLARSWLLRRGRPRRLMDRERAAKA